jgi:HD-GYP domain-containing protein (c-di-GMP phosphodiesterase class II)
VNAQPETRAGERFLQHSGRRFIAHFHAAAQAVALYPEGNDALRAALETLHDTANEILTAEGCLELQRVSGCFVLDHVRLRTDVASQSVFEAAARAFGRHEIGGVTVQPGVVLEDWLHFLQVLCTKPLREAPFAAFRAGLEARGAGAIQVLPEAIRLGDHERRQIARTVYVQSARVARDLLTGARLGKAVNFRRVKRTVQSIVDQVLNNESALLGMTTLREFDEYTFTHSVNVCILSVVFGQRLGLDKARLYELGLCGLLHDIGKMRISSEVINKQGRLTPEEWEQMRLHPREGLLALFAIHGFQDVPYRAMLAAYEHHMKTDFSGYPAVHRERHLGAYSRIISVVDCFDAVTSTRSYRSRPWPADQALRNMRDEPSWGLDQRFVKAFISATGMYPVGTVVQLDTQQYAVVVESNADHPEAPTVRIIADAAGNAIEAGAQMELWRDSPESPQPHIVRAAAREQVAADLSQYFN